MKKVEIAVNCDVGEGINNEEQLFPHITSCNIACGGHYGDAKSITHCLKLARTYKVRVGAHPSYPDAKNFGRVSIDISDEALCASITAQLNFFSEQCKKNNSSLHHIKPHGALYNDVAKNREKAQLFLKAIEPYKKDCFLFVPYNSVVEKYAIASGFKIKREAFADRNYNNDLGLVPRTEPNALLNDAPSVLKHLTTMVLHNVVKTVQEDMVPIVADTFCVHGDTPEAIHILQYIANQFTIQKIKTV